MVGAARAVRLSHVEYHYLWEICLLPAAAGVN